MSSPFPFSCKWFKFLRWCAQIFFPALATLCGTLGYALHWEHAGLLVTAVSAVGCFVGAMVGVSSSTHFSQAGQTGRAEKKEE